MTVCWEAAHKEPCEVGFSGVDPGVCRVGDLVVFVEALGRNQACTPEDETWNIIMEVWKIMFLSNWVICRFHVNLPRCCPNAKWQRVSQSIMIHDSSNQNSITIYISSWICLRCFFVNFFMGSIWLWKKNTTLKKIVAGIFPSREESQI